MPLCRQRRRIFLALGAALFVGPAFASAQGFGIVKKNVTLVRSLPPDTVSVSSAWAAVLSSAASAAATPPCAIGLEPPPRSVSC